MLDAVQGRDTSVRGTISRGRFVQGAQHPRIFGRGYIGRSGPRHIGQGAFRPWDISSKGRFIQGMVVQGRWRPRKVSDKGSMIEEKTLGDASVGGHIVISQAKYLYVKTAVSLLSSYWQAR
jgi:hypothetical protein